MIDLHFKWFLITGIGMGAGILVLDIVWYILRCIWKWINDSNDIKGKSIGWFFHVKICNGKNEQFGVDPALWAVLAFLFFLIPIVIYFALSLYFITLILLVLFLMAHLARFAKRLDKKLKTHAENKEIHNG